MIFNLKYLILPLSIMACINNSCINAMEENKSGEYKNDVNEELKNRVRKALGYVKSMDTEILGEDVADNMVNNFSDFLKGSGTLDNDLLKEIEDIIKTYSERFKLDEFEIEPDTNEDVKINENPISNNITNYSDENEDQIDTTEKNENIQLSPQIIEQLRSDLYYYSNHDNDPSLLDLESKMESGTLTMDEKKFLLKFYNEKNKNKKVDNKYFPVSEDKFNDEENTIYEKEQNENEIWREDYELRVTIVKVKNYLENKALSLDKNSIEYKKIIEQINGFNELLSARDLIINEITEQQQEDLFKLQYEMNEKEQEEISNLQDEITQEQSEKANPTESEEKLLQMIDRSRGLLQTKMLLKEYKPDEHDTIVAKIEECNDLIDSKDIKNNITKTQYEYFKKLQDEN